jgi:hypothetical protein
VKRLAFTCLVASNRAIIRRSPQAAKGRTMKRSRRVILTMMGTAAVGAVSMGFVPRSGCGPGREPVPGPDGRPYCRAIYGGFGGAPRQFHGHGGHGHGG